jgi:hypothetical protein
MTDALEIPLELLIARAIIMAKASPENEAVVNALANKLGNMLNEERVPQWAGVAAMAILMEEVRLKAQAKVEALVEVQDGRATN